MTGKILQGLREAADWIDAHPEEEVIGVLSKHFTEGIHLTVYKPVNRKADKPHLHHDGSAVTFVRHESDALTIGWVVSAND